MTRPASPLATQPTTHPVQELPRQFSWAGFFFSELNHLCLYSRLVSCPVDGSCDRQSRRPCTGHFSVYLAVCNPDTALIVRQVSEKWSVFQTVFDTGF